MKRGFAGWFAGFALLLFLPLTASAQSFNATLTGSVTDPSGASVPDVEVTLTYKATGTIAKSKTGSDGLYSFPNLQSGEYELKASASSFKEYVQRGISVLSNQVARIDVKLELGAETQTIEVVGDASALNFDNAEVKGVISPETIQELPLLVGGVTRSAVALCQVIAWCHRGGRTGRKAIQRSYQRRNDGGRRSRAGWGVFIRRRIRTKWDSASDNRTSLVSGGHQRDQCVDLQLRAAIRGHHFCR